MVETMLRHVVAVLLFLPLPAAADAGRDPISGAEGWVAWIDEAPPGPVALHVTGRIELPTPGHGVRLRFAHMERSDPPVMVLALDIETPRGPVAQVLTWHRAHLAVPGFADDPSAIRIIYGGRTVATIDTIDRIR